MGRGKESHKRLGGGRGRERLSGVLDVITRKKRQHSGTFTLKTNTNIKMYNGNDNESVKKLVEQWECSGKESGTREQGQRVYCFGKNHESELMVGSPLKRRRICPPTSPGSPPRPRTRPPCTPSSRRTCSSSTSSPGSTRRRPSSTSAAKRRAPPSTLLSSKRVISDRGTEPDASRWPSLRVTKDSTWPGTSCSTAGSSSDMNSISVVQTSEQLLSSTKQVHVMTGSNCTSLDKQSHGVLHGSEGEPGGHHRHLLLPRHSLPAQEGASALPFGYSTITSQPGTSANGNIVIKSHFKPERKIQNPKDKEMPEINTRSGRFPSTERRKQSTLKLVDTFETFETANKKQESNVPMLKMIKKEKHSDEERSSKFGRKFGRKKEKEEEELYLDGEKLCSITYLQMQGPDAVPGKPGEAARPGTAGCSSSSSWSCSRGTQGTSQGAGFSLGRSTGDLQGIFEFGRGENIETLYETVLSKRAATISSNFVPPESTQTTGGVAPTTILSNDGLRFAVICGEELGLAETSSSSPSIPGDLPNIREASQQ